MRTAIDTNCISALWAGEPTASRAAELLAAARSSGGLAIAAPVFCELLAYPGATERFVEEFLRVGGIDTDFQIAENVWREAGRRFARQAARRRGATGREPKRLLADFIIGAHALRQADRLLTFDPSRYRRDFPELSLVP